MFYNVDSNNTKKKHATKHNQILTWIVKIYFKDTQYIYWNEVHIVVISKRKTILDLETHINYGPSLIWIIDKAVWK